MPADPQSIANDVTDLILNHVRKTAPQDVGEEGQPSDPERLVPDLSEVKDML